MTTSPRFLQPPDGHFFLFGPRGTGKSTWLRSTFPDALWLDLLESGTHRTLESRPERLEDLVHANPQAEVVVIDEIQRAPELLNGVHRLIEQKIGKRFVLTGSSARKLRQAGVNLLGGRAVRRAMHPFMAAELGAGFELERALTQGLVPLVVSAPQPRDILDAYVGVYLREEVQAESLVRNLGSFGRFLEAVSFSHASSLNLSEVARDCAVGRSTVTGYVEILEDLLLAFRVPVFSRRAKRRLAVHPKLYWFDAGVFASVRPRGPLDRSEEIAGPALEGLVAQHLRAWVDYSGLELSMYFWRTERGQEVDFVLYGNDGFWALEVKNTVRVRPEDLKALKAFREDYPEAKLRLLYRGKDRLLIDGIFCQPCEEFLRELVPGQPLSPTPRKPA